MLCRLNLGNGKVIADVKQLDRCNERSREQIERRLELRAASQELLVRATTGLVTARAGAAVRLSDPAQRWHREAMFHLVQAQTAPGRTATLTRLLR